MKYAVLLFALIIFPAVCLAQDQDVLATGSSPASGPATGGVSGQDQQSQQAQPAQQTEAATVSGSPQNEGGGDREDWFNWNDSVSFDDLRKDDDLQF